MRDRTSRTWRQQGPPSHSSGTHRRALLQIPRLIALVVICATLAVFWQMHSHQFVLWDDPVNVAENPLLHPLTVDHILAFWRAPYLELYIPLTYTVWSVMAAVSRWISGHPLAHGPLDPRLFHSLNLGLHVVSALVVWRLLLCLLSRLGHEDQRGATSAAAARRAWAAAGGALLFAVHPLQVEAVAWVTGLKDVLCGCLALVAVWQYVEYARSSAEAVSTPGRGQARWHYAWATGAFVLALVAKPTAVIVPLVAWILDIWGWQRAWRTRVPALLAWSGIALLWSIMTSQVQPATALAVTPPLWARPLIAGDALTFYLAKLVVPVGLAPDYGRSPAVVLAQSWLWLTGLGPWALAAVLWWQRARVPWLLAAAGVFVAGLLPVLGFVSFAFQDYSTVADRYTYIALLGPAVALAWILRCWPRRALVVGCAAMLGLLGIRSAWQTRYWYDTVALFTHALRVHPESSLAHNNLGMALAAANRLAEAFPHYLEAVRVRPRNAEAHLNLGNALARQGKSQEAIRHYTAAIQLQPTLAAAHNSLGSALADQERFDEALAHYAEALRLRPWYARVYYNLANVLMKQGKVQEALRQYTAALQLQPTMVEAHGNLGAALAEQGRLDEAIYHYTEAIRLQPRYVRAHYNLGVALAKQGRLTEARHHFAEVLRLDPTHAAARRLLESSAP